MAVNTLLSVVIMATVADRGSSASTYQRILEVLKETGGGCSVKALCARLELSPMAVRRPLSLLEGQDLVYARKFKKKAGRPEYRYYLTRSGHERFPRGYSQMAVELLVHLRFLDGKEKINALFERRRKEQIERYRRRVPGKTLEARVHEVTQLLGEDGYMATWEKLGPKRYLIREMNCAVEKVARKFPQTCIYEEGFLAELLQVKVTRRHHILHNEHFCSYLVEG